jgi:hypothetical protein
LRDCESISHGVFGVVEEVRLSVEEYLVDDVTPADLRVTGAVDEALIEVQESVVVVT